MKMYIYIIDTTTDCEDLPDEESEETTVGNDRNDVENKKRSDLCAGE